MINITLPDGSVRQFDKPVTVAEVAGSIGPGLAKAALGGKVDGKLVDLAHRIERDAKLAIVTDKDPDGLDLIRHSTAHLLAYAVKELFPDAQVTIGPVIDNGFYYDFFRNAPFTPEDFVAIEKKMPQPRDPDRRAERKHGQRLLPEKRAQGEPDIAPAPRDIPLQLQEWEVVMNVPKQVGQEDQKRNEPADPEMWCQPFRAAAALRGGVFEQNPPFPSEQQPRDDSETENRHGVFVLQP